MSDTRAFYGSERGDDALQKTKELHSSAKDNQRAILTWFYSVLNILDSKANGLMRVNSSFITIALFFFGIAQAKVGTGNERKPLIEPSEIQVIAAGISLILVLVSTFLCFMIVSVSWKFLGNVEKKGGSYDFDTEIGRLANVVDDRTHYYLIGWYLTLGAAAIPLALWIMTGVVKLL